MKKNKILFILIFICLHSISQEYYCGNIGNNYENVYVNDMCKRTIPLNNCDTNLFASSYIPSDATPIITIPINVNGGEKMMVRVLIGRIMKLLEIVYKR